MKREKQVQDARQRTWWWAENRVVDDLWIAHVGVYAWAVYCVLLRHADDKGRTFPSAAELSGITGISLSEVRRALKILLGSGLVKRAKKGGPKSATVYQIREVPTTKNLSPGNRRSRPRQKVQQQEEVQQQEKRESTVDSTAAFLASLEPESFLPDEEPVRSPKKRGPSRRCPADWTPNEKHREIAKLEEVDLDRELAIFRDHTFGVSKTDWDATFRNWLRNARNVSRAYYNGNGKASQGYARTEVLRSYESEVLV